MSIASALVKPASATPVVAVASSTVEHLYYTTVSSPVGVVLLASTSRGLKAVRLGLNEMALLDELRAEFPASLIERDDQSLAPATAWITAAIAGRPPAKPLTFDVRGTPFQQAVWQALCDIPVGQTRSYSEIAKSIGQPLAVRAVGSACGANPVAIAVPCHRVVGSDGSLGGYRWGSDVKQYLLAAESA
jgi:AraC family transcriptional regulator of adaptative response/methylated-DNA-[protein]-cysteine methyltransferase